VADLNFKVTYLPAESAVKHQANKLWMSNVSNLKKTCPIQGFKTTPKMRLVR